MQQDSSEFISKGSCPSCGSSDANASYTDGHTHCFSCGKHGRADGETQTRRVKMSADLLDGDFQPLLKRGITEDTCRKFGYRVGKMRGDTVQIADYRNDAGDIVAQHIRDRAKEFPWIGDHKAVGLWGKHLWRDGGTRVIITEGEIDAMSIAQVFNLRWPVVSIRSGAKGAKKDLQRDLEWLESYDSVVLCLDMDKPGRDAVAECAPLFSPGKCKVMSLPRKDANEMLQEGLVKELVSAVYEAKTYRPDGIVSAADIRERVMTEPVMGLPYPFPGATKATYGRQFGQLIGIGAGSGVGKTDLITQMVDMDLRSGQTVGILFLEQDVGETGKRLAGKAAGRRFHIPGGDWTRDELVAAWDSLEATGRLHLYDNWGGISWDTIRGQIRYMVQALGCRVLYLDHLTALVACEDDEKKALERIMEELATMAKSLNVILHYVSHLATPDGAPHEEGGRVMGKHFKGSRAIIYWTHMLWGLERNTQAADPAERSRATLRCLKDRFTGNANGMTWELTFDQSTGLLMEAPPREECDGSFGDESGGKPDF